MKTVKIESFEERAIRFAVSAPLAAVETLISTITTILNERARTAALLTPVSSGPVSGGTPIPAGPIKRSRRGLPASAPAPVAGPTPSSASGADDRPYADHAPVDALGL